MIDQRERQKHRVMSAPGSVGGLTQGFVSMTIGPCLRNETAGKRHVYLKKRFKDIFANRDVSEEIIKKVTSTFCAGTLSILYPNIHVTNNLHR